MRSTLNVWASSLISAYRAFIRPQVDFSNVAFNQAFNHFSHQRLKSIQYYVPLTRTKGIRGISKESLFESL